MRTFFGLLFGNTAVRDYAIAGVVLTLLALVGLQSVASLVEGSRQGLRVETARIEKREEGIRNYTVSRSVLDDNIATGSIGKGRPIILDPCTGTVKSK